VKRRSKQILALNIDIFEIVHVAIVVGVLISSLVWTSNWILNVKFAEAFRRPPGVVPFLFLHVHLVITENHCSSKQQSYT
jgi:hypothetical protein